MVEDDTQVLHRSANGPPARVSWWQHYAQAITAAGIDETSRRVIDLDSEYIVERAVFGSGEPGPEWPESRERSGVVMGAVQSGKTASMMAVAAKALDRGVDVVIILAGTRRSLWLQTFERVIAQLDFDGGAETRRVLVPSGQVLSADGGGPAGLYSRPKQLIARALERSRPVLCVVMKHPAHIEQMAKTLHEAIYPVAAQLGKLCHLLVIDDEADDSSIVDAVLEPGADDFERQQKQVPRRIVDLWESRHHEGATVSPHVYATYVAYTATPQANFLQDPNNPLSPRDFAVSLRTPGDKGSVEVRSTSYTAGDVSAMYTGGDIFYRAMATVPLCIDAGSYGGDDASEGPTVALPPASVDALRAYLVASAIKVLRAPGRRSPAAAAAGGTFGSKDEARTHLPKPMSMLVHPAAGMADHFDVAGAIVQWSTGQDAGGVDFAVLGDRHLRVDGVRDDMDSNPGAWKAWLAKYRVGAEAVVAKLGAIQLPMVPTDQEWEVVRQTILGGVVPATLVAVINSDPAADDRPEFEAMPTGDGRWRAPRNLSTIFVSGNVMSRGLTLEGLTTTVFTRSSTTPLADTQMQMQRWFGYRGAYIELCRVFMSGAQMNHFSHYHDNDELLRRDVIAAMETANPGRAPTVTVLQGRDFKATGKFTNLHATSPYPGDKPFFPYTNEPGADEQNLEVLRGMLSNDSVTVESRGAVQAAFSPLSWTLTETAQLLDSLVYPRHGDTVVARLKPRWQSFARAIGVEGDDQWLYRGPLVNSDDFASSASPYSIAAYLRYWSACLNRNVPGLYTYDDPPTKWDLIDVEARRAAAPSFRIGVRFGGGATLQSGPLANLGFTVRPMIRGRKQEPPHVLNGTWGSQNAGDSGRSDQFIDFRLPGADMAAPEHRAPGSNGLVLFHLIGDEQGKLSVAIGYGIPFGGPDFVEARVRA